MAIEFSERIKRIPVYPVASGYSLPEDVAMLASNESPEPPLPAVVEAITKALGGLNRYPDPSNSALRAALSDRFDRMALDRALANLMRAQRDLTVDVLAVGRGEVDARLAAWRQARPEAIDRVIEAVGNLTKGEMTVSRLSVAAGLLSDLARTA